MTTIISILFTLLLLVGVILIVYYISTMNSLRRAQLKIKEALSGIDVALTKRYDTLTKMVDVAKAYAKYEQETIFGAVKLRKGMTMNERKEAMADMDNTRSKLNILAESYPQLGANENYRQLQAAILDVEEHLQAARRAYNANVTKLNQQVVAFPSSIIAGMCGIGMEEYFEAEASKRQDVKMDLNF